MTSRLRSPAVLACVGLALSLLACEDGDDRPGPVAWGRAWEQTQAVIPEAPAFEDHPADLCGEILGEVRARSEEMLPSPSEKVDAAFHDWVERAETIGLDCTENTADFGEQLAELGALARRVDVALAGAS